MTAFEIHDHDNNNVMSHSTVIGDLFSTFCTIDHLNHSSLIMGSGLHVSDCVVRLKIGTITDIKFDKD